jgi:glycosyltransferase involved in cell wall biosynthesis
MLAYWGRRGALCRFTYNLAATATARGRPAVSVSISRSNELFAEFAQLGDVVAPVDTFSSPYGAITALPSVMRLRRSLAEQFAEHGTRAFVSLMPHVWSPLTASVIRRAGVRHIVVAHDAVPHRGDRTAIASRWLLHEARAADQVVALSQAVADRLVATARIPRDRISVMFHPDFDYGVVAEALRIPAGRPLRVLFLGRLLSYKGLGLFVDALELLRRRGVAVEAGVFGSGDMGDEGARLMALGAEIQNRWIDETEFSAILSRHDVVVLSHVAASQSGVVSAAMGAGLPVVVTPVGGLAGQVESEVNGLVAAAVTAEAIAQSIQRLAEDRGLLDRLRQGVLATAPKRSMSRFLDAITALALDPVQGGDKSRQ